MAVVCGWRTRAVEAALVAIALPCPVNLLAGVHLQRILPRFQHKAMSSWWAPAAAALPPLVAASMAGAPPHLASLPSGAGVAGALRSEPQVVQAADPARPPRVSAAPPIKGMRVDPESRAGTVAAAVVAQVRWGQMLQGLQARD